LKFAGKLENYNKSERVFTIRNIFQ
jgi:hypothetical protein